MTAVWFLVGTAAWCMAAAFGAVLLGGWRNALSLFVPGIAANADDPQHDHPSPAGHEEDE